MPEYNPKNPVIKTNLATLGSLCEYIHLLKMPNDEIILPNNIKCNVVDLLNYVSISYIITYNLLYKNGIYLRDMHFENIFIHWLDKNSYMYDQYIGDTEYIIYKCNNKYYKIKTFGFIIKIGDVGASIVHPRKKLYIVGQAGTEMSKTFHLVKDVISYPDYQNFMSRFLFILKFDTFKKIIAHDILSSHPYNKFFYLNVDKKLIKDMQSAEELLEYYDKYSIDKIKKSMRYDSKFLIFE